MKTMMIAAVASIALASAAIAADADPVVNPGPLDSPPAYANAKHRLYDWTGFYVGVNGGGALSDIKWSSMPDATSGTSIGTGGLLGGTLGYNLQAGDRVVVGVEADMDWSGISSTVSTAPPLQALSCSLNSSTNCEFKIPWLATARVRLGYAFGALVPYLTGGVAIARLNADVAGAPYGWEGQNTLGWTAGGGVEYVIIGALRAKVEYSYVDLNGFSCSTSCAFPGDGSAGPVSFNYRGSVIRAGLNYSLGQ
jgi:outer membrane immunogenic protein